MPSKQGRERTYIRKTVPSPDGLFQAYVIVKSDGELYFEYLYLEDKATGEIFKLEQQRNLRFIDLMWATNRYLVFDQQHLVFDQRVFDPAPSSKKSSISRRTLHHVVDARDRAVIEITSYTDSK